MSTKPGRMFILTACLTVFAGCGNTDVRPEIINLEDSWSLNDADATENPDIVNGDSTADTADDDGLTADTPDDGADADIAVPPPPTISVEPTEVDFGFGAINTPKTAEIIITNSGEGQLTVHSLKIMHESTTEFGREFAVVYDASFPATDEANPADSIIAGNSSKTIKLSFTNKGPDQGDVSAWLVIDSNAPGNETVDVSLAASRSGAPICRLQMVPAVVNFGVVASGFSEIREARVINTGTGVCVIKQYSLADCPTSMLSTTCPAPLSGDPSPWFKLVQPPEAARIPPGETGSVRIEYTPPDPSDPFVPTAVNALLSFKIQDEANNTYYNLPECPVDGCEPNVIGQHGDGRTSVLPSSLDFGTVSAGCSSVTEPLCVYNLGDAPLQIQSVDFGECSREISFDNAPEFPVKVVAGYHFCFDVTYRPVNEGDDGCTLRFAVTDLLTPSIAVPISAVGTAETRRTDTFSPIIGADVDVLFVIDDSGSMCEEQERLVTAFSDFISGATTWKNDYRIGVISVNVTEPGVMGMLNRGNTGVTPRFITRSPDAQTQFDRLVAFGCDGASSEREAGLEAAMLALSTPLTTSTGVLCNSTTDCAGNATICGDPANCPFRCMDGHCGGWNSGFIRPDANLEIIMLSDEDDQSIQGVSHYTDYFKAMKSSPDKVHVNSIVGITGVPGGPSDYGNDCVATDGSTAMNGTRYLQASELTGGISGSICEMSFAPIMGEISDAAFLPRLEYALTLNPDPDSIKVLLNGADCTTGWRFASQSNSVVFDADGTCTPVPGNTLKISYDIVCIQ